MVSPERTRLVELECTAGDLRTVLRSETTMRQVTEVVGTEISATWRFAAKGDKLCVVDAAGS